MLAKRIIPCLDVLKGKVTKGVKFQNNSEVGDPVHLARLYSEQGADEIVFYDIGASVENKNILLDWVGRVAREINIPFAVGGGIRTIDDMRAVLLAGAEKISLNTAAVLDPELIRSGAEIFGSQCIVLGVDAKSISRSEEDYASLSSGYEVYIRGGRQATGRDVVDWVKEAEQLGAGEVCINSIDADGTRQGYELELTKKVVKTVSLPVIASGGAGCLEDIGEILQETDCDAALVASLLHYGETTIVDIKKYLASKGITVRL